MQEYTRMIHTCMHVCSGGVLHSSAFIVDLSLASVVQYSMPLDQLVISVPIQIARSAGTPMTTITLRIKNLTLSSLN